MQQKKGKFQLQLFLVFLSFMPNVKYIAMPNAKYIAMPNTGQCLHIQIHGLVSTD